VARTGARPWFRKPVFRSLTSAATGGVILLAVDAAFNIKNLEGPGLLPYLASAFVGGVVGWIYDLGTRMSEITRESIEKMTELSQILEFQQQPLRLLVNARIHAATIGILLKESIGEQYKAIASVDPNKYLAFLKQALNHSSRFNGVMRNRVAWFRDNADGESYLQDLARRRMREKVRIFIIDDRDVEAMQEDLADRELMEFYWQKTGPVDTYWISESDLRKNYPDLRMPDDFALFDSELLIRYDTLRHNLFFDIVDEQALERRIFAKLQMQLQNKSDRPFIRIAKEPATVRARPGPVDATR
jgi:hypothetical protein